MSISIRELFEIVAVGDDLAAEDAAFLCQRLDPFLWQKVLAAAGKEEGKVVEAATALAPSLSGRN